MEYVFTVGSVLVGENFFLQLLQIFLRAVGIDKFGLMTTEAEIGAMHKSHAFYFTHSFS